MLGNFWFGCQTIWILTCSVIDFFQLLLNNVLGYSYIWSFQGVLLSFITRAAFSLELVSHNCWGSTLLIIQSTSYVLWGIPILAVGNGNYSQTCMNFENCSACSFLVVLFSDLSSFFTCKLLVSAQLKTQEELPENQELSLCELFSSLVFFPKNSGYGGLLNISTVSST